jgi:hypothetical protein
MLRITAVVKGDVRSKVRYGFRFPSAGMAAREE